MFKCCSCGEVFEEPDSKSYCYEEYFGVSSLFGDRHYGTYSVCPECGSEDIEDYHEPDEDDEEEADE